jgi:hypothetical protein
MPCEWLKGPDGAIIHINRGRQRDRVVHCTFCNRDYKQSRGKLCDFPIGDGKTCDAQMCSECSRTIGRGDVPIGHGLSRPNETFDLCPIHRGKAVVIDGVILPHD